MNDLPEINAVLEHYDARTKDRRSYATNCIFHEDRTPSLSVNTEKNVWNCKSCGQAGNSYKLIMLKEDTDFAGARDIAASLGLPAGGSGGGSDDVREGAYLTRRGGGQAQAARSRSGSRASGYVPRWRRG